MNNPASNLAPDQAPETTNDQPQPMSPKRGRPKKTRAQLPQAAAGSAPPLDENDPRVRAAKRAAELREHLGDDSDGVDEFYIDLRIVPQGWSYEWKRREVLGKEDHSYTVALAQRGWEAVPASRHPEMMPKGWTGSIIERKGMVLMERPQEITDEARIKEQKKARNQVRQKEEQLNMPPPGQFDRRNKDAPLVKINKSYEPMPVPDK